MENRFQVLAAAFGVSILLHGLILAAVNAPLPFDNSGISEAQGITLELASMGSPTEVFSQAEAAPLQDNGPEPQKTREKRETLLPKEENLAPPVKSVAAKTQSAKKTTGAKNSKALPGKGMVQKTGAVKGTPAAATGHAETAPAPVGGSGNPKPPYPRLAVKRGQEGEVILRCQVDAEGRVTSISVLKSSGFKLLDEAALKTIGKWKFRPGIKNGVPAAGSVLVPTLFKLR